MKYSKIDIRNTVRNLIDYFKMQNEVPSQKEIVEVWSKIKEGVEKKKQRRKERYILVAITSAAAFIGVYGWELNGILLIINRIYP